MDENVQPENKAIKKRIENLITRDYLERDRENPNVFRYLAFNKYFSEGGTPISVSNLDTIF